MKQLKPTLFISVAVAAVASSVLLAANALGASPPGPQATPASPSAPNATGQDQPAVYKAMVMRYCAGCHGERNPQAGLTLSTIDFSKIDENADVLEKVVRKLNGRMMPPPGAPRPDDALTGQFVGWLETHLDGAANTRVSAKKIALHRLNRKEYANAISDLLQLDLDPRVLLPQDDASDGFDNIAEVLQVSPAFVDQYINAARTVAVQAVGDLKIRSTETVLKPPPGLNQYAHVAGLPLGTRGGFRTEFVFPADGRYELRFSTSRPNAYEAPMREGRLVTFLDGKVIYDSATAPDEPAKITGVDAPDRVHKVGLSITAGKHVLSAAFVGGEYLADLPALADARPSAGMRGPVLTGMDVVGPAEAKQLGPSPSREAIFICRPKRSSEEAACARKILARLARHAFRRPVNDADLAAPMRFYESGLKNGGFEAGIQQGLMAILASPKFLYRTTTPPNGLAPGTVYAVNDIDLASRLSFFLWSSLPDEQLIALAEQKKLHQPKVLDAQVARMLADPRAESLVTNFGFQWLQLRSLDTTAPDPTIFPEFDPALQAAFTGEIKLFLDSVLREDHSVLDLLTAKYTFVNERLAKHYGIPNVGGNRFRRVELANPARYGLLGKGAVLMVTSYANRTSPVLRGAWVLENILGTPPHPPPPSVGGLADNVAGQKALTIRALLEMHRKSPTCNACHGIMDPIGLSLENFDAIGGWRVNDRLAGDAIDASSTMVTGDKMNGPADLRAVMMKRPEQFVRTFTQKLMIFGLGRSLDHTDMPRVRAIVRAAAADNYRFSALVLGIVHSDAFLKSQVPQSAPEPTRVASARN